MKSEQRTFDLMYTSFNEYGGIVQYAIKIKAFTLGQAKEKLLKGDSSAWDITERSVGG